MRSHIEEVHQGNTDTPTTKGRRQGTFFIENMMKLLFKK